MNRDQKAAVIDEIADQIRESEAVFAVDYRGISVPQAAGLRETLRGSESTFRVTKNTLTVLAADKAQQEALKDFLSGPTALTFVKGDAASAAKSIADFQKAQPDLLPFKGGTLNGVAIDAAQLGALAKLPTREVLYQQLVGMVASPISGLARTLSALIGGLAVQLGQINEKKRSGEIPADADPPAAAAAPAAEAPGTDDPAPAVDSQPEESTKDDQDAEPPAAPTTSDEPAEGADDASTTSNESEEN